MRKGITPIISIIILLLITVGLAATAWSYMSNYMTGLTSNAVEVADVYCVDGTAATVVLRNTGTETLTLTGCSAGNNTQCTDLTIIRTSGLQAMNLTASGSGFSPNSVRPGSITTFTDENCALSGNSSLCNYRFVPCSGRGVVGTVQCGG